VTYVADANTLPRCPEGATTVTSDCYAPVIDPVSCPGAQYLVQLNRTDAEIAAGTVAAGTRLSLSCK
jgi:hypothetical protein